MFITKFDIFESKVIIRLKDRICETAEDLLSSPLFIKVLKNYILYLQKRGSILLSIFGDKEINDDSLKLLIDTLKFLSKMPAKHAPKIIKGSEIFFRDSSQFFYFIENLYNYWRSFDRFIVCDSEGNHFDKRPDTTFNSTVEQLMHLVRGVYRDIEENISGTRPRIYRQVRAGAEVACIALPIDLPFPGGDYKKLSKLPIIRQVLLYPPLVLNPPMNKRKGKFEKVNRNPLELININNEDWLCYPAKVGKLLILIYFNKKFFELGFSMCNLFELAENEDLLRKPDAVYFFGVPGEELYELSDFPTVFYDDAENDMIIAACPDKNEFGYFGYLKKMVLTLHNIKMMKTGRFPFHGALIKFLFKGDKSAVALIIGDTGAGKSETLEAFRAIGEELIQDLVIIADDMGSLELSDNGEIIGFGTEIGAFLRLDDLHPGYPYNHIDRSIIMSPSQTNARLVIPVAPYDNVIKGEKIDFILYANNYEQIDDDHPVIEKFDTAAEAIKLFRDGAVMSKGTTTTTGLVHTYFANIFGPVQYKEIHEKLATDYFNKFFENGLFVGQIRTRLGIQGFEHTGPEEAARELIKLLQQS